MVFIDNVYADEVMDSRGNPTVRATVILSDGTKASAIVPSGASTGKREALELRDADSRFLGKGVLKAVENVNTRIADELIGQSPFNQAEVDAIMKELDGTNIASIERKFELHWLPPIAVNLTNADDLVATVRAVS